MNWKTKKTMLDGLRQFGNVAVMVSVPCEGALFPDRYEYFCRKAVQVFWLSRFDQPQASANELGIFLRKDDEGKPFTFVFPWSSIVAMFDADGETKLVDDDALPIELLLQGATPRTPEHNEMAEQLCESPAEVAMLRCLVSAGLLGFHQQFEFSGKLRFDFAFPDEKVAVEVDGYKWHDSSPEQAERDRKRDRLASSVGWLVLRFAAREVLRDAASCAREVASHITRRGGQGAH